MIRCDRCWGEGKVRGFGLLTVNCPKCAEVKNEKSILEQVQDLQKDEKFVFGEELYNDMNKTTCLAVADAEKTCEHRTEKTENEINKKRRGRPRKTATSA